MGEGLASPFIIKPDAIYSVLNCFSTPIDQTINLCFYWSSLLELFSLIVFLVLDH